MTSYLTSTDNISLSRTVFEIFDFKVFRVWPWPLTPKGHLGSKNVTPFESPYRTSYLTSMDNFSLSRTVFEIFDFKVFRVWPWPLTPKGHLGSNKNHIIRKFIYDFLFDFYGQHLSISYRFRGIQLLSFQGLTLTFYTIRRPIYDFLFDFCGQHLSISYRFRNKLFDFKVSRVRPWPLTPKGHLRSKKFIPFESPYMTSYLTSMDNISLSCTVSEIFDFKVSRVRPWPSTPKGHLG